MVWDGDCRIGRADEVEGEGSAIKGVGPDGICSECWVIDVQYGIGRDGWLGDAS